MDMFQKVVDKTLRTIDVQINGNRPWDIIVNDPRFYRRVLLRGSLGLGEAYTDGWWDAAAPDQFFDRLLRSGTDERFRWNIQSIASGIVARVANLGAVSRAFEVGQKHYDIGNDVFERMLDPRMVYSCGYWKNVNTLDESETAKLDLICRKIGLLPGQNILDIGCGWGSFLKYASEKYKVQSVGVTVSKEQANYARESCQGLPIDIRLQDYRDIKGEFDHIVSVGMFEHVDVKNYRTYMQTAQRALKDNGLFLLHTIGSLKSSAGTDPWIGKYIFPNSMLPSMRQITTAVEGLFVIEDVHNFGVDYDKTLMAWFHNFDAHWPELRDKYGDRFYRMWKYYLLCCAGAFRARHIQLWQIVLSKHGVRDGYVSVR